MTKSATEQKVFLKDPEEDLDYKRDWSEDMGADEDTIAESEWFITPAGLTLGTDSKAPTKTDTTVTIWLSGGVLGKTYSVTNRITTAAGRIFERSFKVRIFDR